jgi:plasmid stability protein
MPNLLIRGLDDAVIDRLKKLAEQHNRSPEEEAKAMLEKAANEPLMNARRSPPLVTKP